MLRIKNKRANIPNGYLYVQRETGFDVSKVMPHTINDFNAVARAIQQHRMSNPQFKLNTNLAAIEAELEAVNVARIASIPGAKDVYLMDVGGASPSFQPAPNQPTLAKLVAVAGAVKTGKDVLFDWEESGQPPVTQEVADQRASICATCPQNGQGGLSRYFTIPAAAMIKARFEKLHEMKMSTPSDAQLGICEACLCPLKLKCWTPLDFILKYMTDDVRAKLDGRCWILGEQTPEKGAA